MLIFSSLTKINIFLYRPAVFRLSTIQWAGGNSNALNSKNEAQSNRKKLPLPVLIMYTKDNCSLCDQAKTMLQKFEGDFQLKEVDITEPENKRWFDKYKYDIPVFHFNGEYLMRHKVHEELLKKTLRDFEKINK